MKSKLKNLVLESYHNGQLDSKTVELLADHMNRQALKQYISLLKHEENKKQVTITSPKALVEADRKKVQDLFPKKQIIYVLDPAMISGIRIVDRDSEYEVSLNQTFNDIINHLTKYD